MGFEDLSPEFLEKAKTCKSAEELAELAKSIGIELSSEELTAIAGGELANSSIRDTSCLPLSRPQCPILHSCTELFKCSTDGCASLMSCSGLFSCSHYGTDNPCSCLGISLSD